MYINIAELFSQTDKDVKVSRTLPNTILEFGGETYQITEPVKVDLDLTKLESNDYLASGVISATLVVPCNRCMEDVLEEVKADFSKELKTGHPVDGEEELHEYLEGAVLDLEKLVLDEVYMNVPMKVLCKDDCQGLCRTCGKNLNHETCDCENDNIDPRLAGLKDLLNEFKEV